MPAHEFSLTLEVSRDAAPPQMLHEIWSQSLRHVGCPADRVNGLVAGLDSGVVQALSAGGVCRVHISLKGKDITVSVSSSAGEIWQADCQKV